MCYCLVTAGQPGLPSSTLAEQGAERYRGQRVTGHEKEDTERAAGTRQGSHKKATTCVSQGPTWGALPVHLEAATGSQSAAPKCWMETRTQVFGSSDTCPLPLHG